MTLQLGTKQTVSVQEFILSPIISLSPKGLAHPHLPTHDSEFLPHTPLFTKSLMIIHSALQVLWLPTTSLCAAGSFAQVVCLSSGYGELGEMAGMSFQVICFFPNVFACFCGFLFCKRCTFLDASSNFQNFACTFGWNLENWDKEGFYTFFLPAHFMPTFSYLLPPNAAFSHHLPPHCSSGG